MLSHLPESYYIEALGWAGALFFLVSYALLVKGYWKSTRLIYHIFNLLGSILLVVNTLYFGSWSATFINAAWGLIALYGIIKRGNTD